MKPIETSRKKDEKVYDLNKFLIRAALFVFLFGLTVVCLSAPLLDKFDKWAADINNQVKILCFVAFVFGLMFIPRLFKK